MSVGVIYAGGRTITLNDACRFESFDDNLTRWLEENVSRDGDPTEDPGEALLRQATELIGGTYKLSPEHRALVDSYGAHGEIY